ncbi:hypothetical protein LUL50_000706 [Staphylococcus pseudintermedius]|nr:hypothetical protein [Staphylococcus pseudintermedius]
MTKSEALKIVNRINKLLVNSDAVAMVSFNKNGNDKADITFIHYHHAYGHEKSTFPPRMQIKILHWYDDATINKHLEIIEKTIGGEAFLNGI